MRSASDSLRRLKVEVIDLYQLHAPDRNVPLERTMRAKRENFWMKVIYDR
ncbi:MAG: hypothetical protein CM1200mP35_07160 [Chloroflexota bacterium]|nr:MAG: hypothetical protein CM1200mP35_07160 [Chloroflexota bacterium]